MGEVVNFPIPLDGDLGRDFITDCARHCEGLLDETAIKTKYRFDDNAWASLGDNDALVKAVETEKTRRIRDGSSARERAQLLFAQAPSVLGEILHGEGVSPRHKIESARELRVISANGPEATPAADRFSIVINLGSDTLAFNKSIAIDPEDTDPNDTGATLEQSVLAITAKKKDGDDGEFN